MEKTCDSFSMSLNIMCFCFFLNFTMVILTFLKYHSVFEFFWFYWGFSSFSSLSVLKIAECSMPRYLMSYRVLYLTRVVCLMQDIMFDKSRPSHTGYYIWQDSSVSCKVLYLTGSNHETNHSCQIQTTLVKYSILYETDDSCQI